MEQNEACSSDLAIKEFLDCLKGKSPASRAFDSYLFDSLAVIYGVNEE